MAKNTVAPEETVERVSQNGPPELTAAAPKMVVTASQGLNLRLGPGSEFDVVSVLPEGAEVTVWQTWADGRGAQGWFEFHVPGWAYVFTGEFCGWVRREFLAERPAGDLV